MAVDVQELLKEYDAVVFDKDNCGECRKTEGLMTDLKVNFITVNMSHDKEALKKAKADGHRQAPIVYTSNESWSGHNENKVNSLAEGSPVVEEDDTWDF